MVDVDARRARCLVGRVGAIRLPGRLLLSRGPHPTVGSCSSPGPRRTAQGAGTFPDADQVGLAHERAARTNHAPDTAELGHVVAEDLALAAIADVVVEGTPAYVTCRLPSARRVVPRRRALTPLAARSRVLTTYGGQAFAHAPVQTPCPSGRGWTRRARSRGRSAHAHSRTVLLRARALDGRGFAVYAFTRDPRGKSVCTGACAKAWPPYVVRTRLRAASGVRHASSARRGAQTAAGRSHTRGVPSTTTSAIAARARSSATTWPSSAVSGA